MIQGINRKCQYTYGVVSKRQERWGNNREIMAMNFPEWRNGEQQLYERVYGVPNRINKENSHQEVWNLRTSNSKRKIKNVKSF